MCTCAPSTGGKCTESASGEHEAEGARRPGPRVTALGSGAVSKRGGVVFFCAPRHSTAQHRRAGCWAGGHPGIPWQAKPVRAQAACNGSRKGERGLCAAATTGPFQVAFAGDEVGRVSCLLLRRCLASIRVHCCLLRAHGRAHLICACAAAVHACTRFCACTKTRCMPCAMCCGKRVTALVPVAANVHTFSIVGQNTPWYAHSIAVCHYLGAHTVLPLGMLVCIYPVCRFGAAG